MGTYPFTKAELAITVEVLESIADFYRKHQSFAKNTIALLDEAAAEIPIHWGELYGEEE